jgi:hypothetical protein
VLLERHAEHTLEVSWEETLIVAQVVASVLEAHRAFISMGQANALFNVGNYLSPRVLEFLATLL